MLALGFSEAHSSYILPYRYLHTVVYCFRLSLLSPATSLFGISLLLFFLLASSKGIATAMVRASKELSSTPPDVRELPDVIPNDTSEKLGNEWDQRGMARIGKKQELRREFHFFSITGYAMILGCSWEFALMSVRSQKSTLLALSANAHMLIRSTI